MSQTTNLKSNKYKDIYEYAIANKNKNKENNLDYWSKEFNDKLIDATIIKLKESTWDSMCPCLQLA